MVAIAKPWPEVATADLIAVAIVAAARSYGDDPSICLTAKGDHLRRCLAPALRAIVAEAKTPKIRLAPILGLNSTGHTLYRPSGPSAVKAEDAAIAAIRAFLAAAPAEIPEPAVSGDQALIAKALAAGMVTVLPPGHAAGLSGIERELWTAVPPRPESEQWGSKATSRRGGFRSSLSRSPRRVTA